VQDPVFPSPVLSALALLALLQPRVSAEDAHCVMPAGEGKKKICTRCPGSGRDGPPVLQKPRSAAFPAAELRFLVEEAGRACPRPVLSAQKHH